MDTERIKALFRAVNAMLPAGIQDDLFELICQLCIEQGRAAFLEGFRVGGQWIMEMRQK